MKLKSLFIFLFLIISLNSPISAYFMDFANGVRPSGMGEAFVAVADDANSALFNPAGYARLDAWELTGMYADLYSNLNVRLYNEADDGFGYNFISLGVPVGFLGGGLGAGWTQFNTVFYQENTVTLSYGKRLWEPYIMDSGVFLDVGASVKLLHWMVEGGEYVTPEIFTKGTEKYGFTADVGILASLFEGFNIGLSVDNVIPANVGMFVEEIVPAIYRVGTAYTYTFPAKQEWLDSLMVTAELSARNWVYVPKFGVESRWFNYLVALRAGVNAERFTSGLSFCYAGLEADLGLQLDYAFSYPFQLADSLGTHRVGMTVRWGSLEKQQDAKVRKTLEVMATANAVIKKSSTAQKLAEEVALILRAAIELSKTEDPNKAQKIKAAIESCSDKIFTAKLNAKIALEKAEESSEKILNIASEANETVVKVEIEIKKVQSLYETLILELKAAEISKLDTEKAVVIQDKYPNKIVVGIEKKVFTDFGNLKEINSITNYLRKHIEKTSGLEVEWKYVSPAEMQLGLRQGEIDILVSYESDFAKFEKDDLIQPQVTIQSHGKTSQQCCLLVLADSEIKAAEDLHGKRIGYSNIRLKRMLKDDFYQTVDGFSTDTYFKFLEKHKHVRGSLTALQMDVVDAVVEYEYILDVIKKGPDLPKVKIIARSQAKPNTYLYVTSSQNKTKNGQMDLLMAALLKFHSDPKAKEFLEFFKIERFVPSK